MGVVSPNGIGAPAFADALRNGRSGVRRLKGIESDGLRSSAAAQVLDLDFEQFLSIAELRRVPRLVPMALAASREALAQAKLHIDPDDIERQRQIGVSLGTGGGG